MEWAGEKTYRGGPLQRFASGIVQKIKRNPIEHLTALDVQLDVDRAGLHDLAPPIKSGMAAGEFGHDGGGVVVVQDFLAHSSFSKIGALIVRILSGLFSGGSRRVPMAPLVPPGGKD